MSKTKTVVFDTIWEISYLIKVLVLTENIIQDKIVKMFTPKLIMC